MTNFEISEEMRKACTNHDRIYAQWKNYLVSHNRTAFKSGQWEARIEKAGERVSKIYPAWLTTI